MNTLFIIATIILVLLLGYMVFKYLKMNTMENIRNDVYQLFLQAKHQYQKSGIQKMEWVVQLARSMLPEWSHIIITEEFLKKTLQIWFDGVEDLLDDGAMNHSGGNK